jgi:hypothetical protein
MQPMIMHALASERVREFQADAAAAGRTRRSRRGWAFTAVARAGRSPVLPLAGRPLRGPRSA